MSEISVKRSNRNKNKMKDGLRQCYICKEYKELDRFYTTKNRNKIYYRPDCKECNIKSVKSYAADNLSGTKLTKRAWTLKNTYGITLDQYNEILKNQDFKCGICKRHYLEIDSKRYRHLAVDHDRRCCGPGKACEECRRGLLCDRCNRGLGLLGDDIDTLKEAMDYLIRFAYKAKNKMRNQYE